MSAMVPSVAPGTPLIPRKAANAPAAPARPSQPLPVADTLIRRAERAIFNHPTTRNAVSFHWTGAQSEQVLLDAIKGAKQSFSIETYEFHDDRTGHAVLKALA